MNTRLWVDFNEIEDDRYIEADLEFADFFLSTELAVGKRADLFDGAGHECEATVVEVDSTNKLVKLTINWDTWTSPAQRRVWQPISAGQPSMSFAPALEPPIAT
jgi:hypothetical protein